MQDIFDFIDFKFLFSMITIIIILIIYLILNKILSWFIKANHYVLLDDLSSGIKFFTRILAGYFVISTIAFFYDLPSEIILLLTALAGTIISLSSMQIINNFLAGLVILSLKPYSVDDFINLGDYEGRVARITLNYTKLLTINDVFVLVPNRFALKADIINYSVEQKEKKDLNSYLTDVASLLEVFSEKKVTRYSFNLALPLEKLNTTLTNLKTICLKNSQIFGYEPSFFLFNLGYKAEYQFVIKSKDSETIRTNLKSFRNELLKSIYNQ